VIDDRMEIVVSSLIFDPKVAIIPKKETEK
jgi:hypothetical protein